MKKLISKFIRVATEGLTIDGREITAQQIAQMAANYAPEKYGARIWIEHFRSLFADGAFPALGDVVALKSEKQADGKLALFAQLRPNDKLLEINKQGQKVFSSIEIDPNFAGSGEAYLVGLAVTDSPASLGTEMLSFSQKNRTDFADGSKVPTNSFSESLEVDGFEFSEEADTPEPGPSLLSKVKDILAGSTAKTDTRFGDMQNSIVALAEGLDDLNTKVAALTIDPPKGESEFADQVKALSAQLAALNTQLNNEADPKVPTRPEATGLNTGELTDC